jgi:TetR/AcrR family transcriptional regulator
VALELFAVHGYDSVSTTQIAKQAQMAQSMVHYHFRTKEQIWIAAISYLMHQRGRFIPPNIEGYKGLDSVEQLRLLTRRLMQMNTDDSRFMRIVMREGTVASRRLDWLIETYLWPDIKELKRSLAEGIAEKRIKARSVDHIVLAILAITSIPFCTQPLSEKTFGSEMVSTKSFTMLEDVIHDLIFEGILTN